MKKRLLIICSIIGILLAGFQFPIYADEEPSDTPSSVPVPNSIRLDQYFFDNYDLLPYIESDGNQYINTQILPDNNLRINIKFSGYTEYVKNYNALFGTRVANNNNSLFVEIIQSDINYALSFGRMYFLYNSSFSPFVINSISFDKNIVYLNNLNIKEFDDFSFESTYPIYIFSLNSGGTSEDSTNYRLYSFNIYDYDSESFVRYYYPARSKASGIIGLYDAVSDTFVTTSGSVPFSSPIADQVLNLQIGSFLTSSIGWVTDILEFAFTTPIILVFIAIALAGVMFRWARRIVHF